MNDRPRAEDTAQRSDRPSAPDDVVERVLRGAGELVEYGRHYLHAKTDAAKLKAREALIVAALGAIGFLTGVGLLIVAGAMIFTGIAAGLGEWFGGRRWLGDLVAGVVLFAGLSGGVWGSLYVLRRSSRQKTISKYEERKHDQRQRFGHDVAKRAAGTRDE